MVARARRARAARTHIACRLRPNSYGGSWQEGGARAASPPLQGLAPRARRPRAAGAPWEARARAARVQTAGEDLVVVVVVVVVASDSELITVSSHDSGTITASGEFNHT